MQAGHRMPRDINGLRVTPSLGRRLDCSPADQPPARNFGVGDRKALPRLTLEEGLARPAGRAAVDVLVASFRVLPGEPMHTAISRVWGENVRGIDPQLVLDKDGKAKSTPEIDRRIEICRRYHESYGEILVQMNVEDTRFGVTE